MIKNQKNKKGISLIVLVITIIVIIILAAAIMLNIDNNNPIENAKKAKKVHNLSVYQEEIELYAVNQYSNNTSFNKDALNAFDEESVKNIITSILDEDAKKYIIWQGKLVEKDGTTYKYLNGEDVKVFGKFSENGMKGELTEQVTLTESMLDFAKKFEEVQKTITNPNERLIYNGGYISNCATATGQQIGLTVFKARMPEGIEVKRYTGQDFLSGSSIGTDNLVYYNGELVAKTVYVGDVVPDDRGDITSMDLNTFRNKFSSDKITIGQLMASDIDGNGIFDQVDIEIFKNYWSNIAKVVNQNRPAVIPKIGF